MSRAYTTRRLGIVNAIVEKLKDIDGSGTFLSDLNEKISISIPSGSKVMVVMMTLSHPFVFMSTSVNVPISPGEQLVSDSSVVSGGR